MNFGQILGQFRNVMLNPMGFLQSKGFPADVMQNPQSAVQQLLSSGKMSQEQFNQLREMALRIQQDPSFSGIFK